MRYQWETDHPVKDVIVQQQKIAEHTYLTASTFALYFTNSSTASTLP